MKTLMMVGLALVLVGCQLGGTRERHGLTTYSAKPTHDDCLSLNGRIAYDKEMAQVFKLAKRRAKAEWGAREPERQKALHAKYRYHDGASGLLAGQGGFVRGVPDDVRRMAYSAIEMLSTPNRPELAAKLAQVNRDAARDMRERGASQAFCKGFAEDFEGYAEYWDVR